MLRKEKSEREQLLQRAIVYRCPKLKKLAFSPSLSIASPSSPSRTPSLAVIPATSRSSITAPDSPLSQDTPMDIGAKVTIVEKIPVRMATNCKQHPACKHPADEMEKLAAPEHLKLQPKSSNSSLVVRNSSNELSTAEYSKFMESFTNDVRNATDLVKNLIASAPDQGTRQTPFLTLRLIFLLQEQWNLYWTNCVISSE